MKWYYCSFASGGSDLLNLCFSLLCHTASTNSFRHEGIVVIPLPYVFFRLFNSVTFYSWYDTIFKDCNAMTGPHISSDVFTNILWLDVFCMIQVHEIRRHILQSPSFKLADTELSDYIKAMTTLLTDPSRLATDALAMQALVQLQRVIYYLW